MTVVAMSHDELSRYDTLLRVQRRELRVQDAATLLEMSRRQIYQLVATGQSLQQIEAALQRHRSTINRELKGNRHLDNEPLFRGYLATAAQTVADRRRVRGGKIVRKPEFAAYIARRRLSAACSPEQIAG